MENNMKFYRDKILNVKVNPKPAAPAEDSVLMNMGGFIADCYSSDEEPTPYTLEGSIDEKLCDMRGFISRMHIRCINSDLPDWLVEIAIRNPNFNPASATHIAALKRIKSRVDCSVLKKIIGEYFEGKPNFDWFYSWYINTTIDLVAYSENHIEISITQEELINKIGVMSYNRLNVTEQLIYYFLNYCEEDEDSLCEHTYFQCAPEFIAIVSDYVEILIR